MKPFRCLGLQGLRGVLSGRKKQLAGGLIYTLGKLCCRVVSDEDSNGRNFSGNFRAGREFVSFRSEDFPVNLWRDHRIE
jgi:hypothetical protein